MTRRRQPIDVSETILRPVRRLEIYRRTLDHLRAHRDHLVATGAGKRAVATIDGDIAEFAGIVSLCEIHPLDTPQPEPVEALPEQPLVMPGSESFMHDFIDGLAS